MNSNKKLSDKELRQMVILLKRYASMDMDQFDLWKFDTDFGKVFVEISMKPSGPEESYTDINKFMEVS